MDVVQGKSHRAFRQLTCVRASPRVYETDWATYLLTHHNNGDGSSGSIPNAALSSLLAPISSIAATLHRHLLPLIDHVSKNPDIASITLLVIVLLVSLKILNILYRAVVFWISLAFKLVFWGTVVVVGLFVWSRGVEGAAQDLTVWGRYWVDVWTSEYARFQDQLEDARKFQMLQQQQAQAQGQQAFAR
ncbi:hypothetical protein DIS24_g11282 [Lasiodiplodia hormozganensis]|uniref:Uncharacterized protein n=1 Tax=Lasiodiplodia hormozganensis TaxID=869390 RepID=A0AA40C2T0_9PEZI|nr:hypothetical protein DIS24_g11282 [Lasiodiplodia hormozganensis]